MLYSQHTVKATVAFLWLLMSCVLLTPPGSFSYAGSGNVGSLVPNGLSSNREKLAKWHPQFRERCYFQEGANSHNPTTETIQTLLTLLRSEPGLTDELLAKAKDVGAALCIDDRIDGNYGYFDYEYGVIAVKDFLTLHEQLIILVHELRHLDQYSRGFGQSLDYDMDEMARLTWADEADAHAVAILYAWRMKARGVPEVWQALSEFENYADIAMAFEAEMSASNDELMATRAAFIQWYTSLWRTDIYAKGSFMNYLDSLDETNKIQSYALLSEHYFDELCVLPDGRNYGCHLTKVITRLP